MLIKKGYDQVVEKICNKENSLLEAFAIYYGWVFDQDHEQLKKQFETGLQYHVNIFLREHMDDWKLYKDSNPELATLEEMRFIIPRIKKYVSRVTQHPDNIESTDPIAKDSLSGSANFLLNAKNITNRPCVECQSTAMLTYMIIEAIKKKWLNSVFLLFSYAYVVNDQRWRN